MQTYGAVSDLNRMRNVMNDIGFEDVNDLMGSLKALQADLAAAKADVVARDKTIGGLESDKEALQQQISETKAAINNVQQDLDNSQARSARCGSSSSCHALLVHRSCASHSYYCTD